MRFLLEKRLDFSNKGREGLKSQSILHIVVFTKTKNCRIRVIKISSQKDALWRFALRFDEHTDKYYPIKVGARDAFLKAAYGRLAGQFLLIIKQSLAGNFHYRVFPQFIAVSPF